MFLPRQFPRRAVWWLVTLSSFCILFGPGADRAEALPAFARRYSLPCHFCHEGYPKLSIIGQQFKERGFRLDNETSDVRAWLKSIPASVRSTFRRSFTENDDSSFGIFRLVSAGNLGSRVSYWIDQDWFATAESFDRIGTDNAYARVEILPDELYVKAGRFELDLPFTQARSPQLFAYDLYFFNTGFETENLGMHQDGIELGGFLATPTRWSVAIVSGQNTDEQEELNPSADRFDANVFGRLSHLAGESRFGVYTYIGRNALARRNPNPAPGEQSAFAWENDHFRLGADGSTYFGEVHLFGTVMYGRNSNGFADGANPEGTGEGLPFSGGFVQADVALRDILVASARYELIRGTRPGERDTFRTFSGFYPAVKFWIYSQLRAAFEVGFRNQGRPTEGILQIEYVF